jgi:DNA ligase-1
MTESLHSLLFPQEEPAPDVIIGTLPILYHRSKNGKTSTWQVGVEYRNKEYWIVTHYGYDDGEKQTAEVRVKTGKNIGKSNETTLMEQALKEAKSKWENKKLQNYRESMDEDTMLLPMLAHRYHDHKDKVTFPCFIQRKLNGVRVLAHISDDGVKYFSRKGKEYETLHHWDELLLKHFPAGTILDGEAFNPDLNFQQIVRLVKRVKASRENIEHDTLKYWVYDVVQESEPFIMRNAFLHKRFMHFRNSMVTHVPSYPCLSHQDILNWHNTFIGEGFEGSMIRDQQSLYQVNYRSYGLLKLKDFIDEEFLITGGKSGTGKDEGTVIFICRTVSKDPERPPFEFFVRPKGTWEERKEYFDNLQSYVGKWLTVRYQEKSEDGMPIFPVGVGIRDITSE